MLYFRVFLTTLACFPFVLAAQIQWNPYAGLFTGGREMIVVGPTDGVDVYEGDRYVLGLDALFGRAPLALAAGFMYHPNSYRTEGGGPGGFDYHQLFLPVGLAYRLLPVDLDINLVPSAMVVPRYVLYDGGLSEITLPEGLQWGGRFGATLYLDYLTVGVHHHVNFSGGSGSGMVGPDGGSAAWLLILGGRF